MASDDIIKGGDKADKALRLIGEDNSCVKIENLSAEDNCLFNPSTCHLNANGVRGFSMSFWLNLPNSFDTTKRYIFDTGGTETGKAGVSVFYKHSETGSDFSQKLTVLVSAGSRYWQVVLNGLLSAYTWSNVAVRWSADIESASGIEYGLQVFVNKTPAVWTRSSLSRAIEEPSAAETETTSVSSPTSRWTVGCRSDGSAAMVGRVDELAVWYWRLRDQAVKDIDKPSNANEYGEMDLIFGGMQFAQTPTSCQETGCLPGKAVDPPKAYLSRNSKPASADEAPIGDSDVTPALEGDCQVDPSTWKGESNMIKCVDTVNELRQALTSNPNFKALPFLQALVRIVDKAPPAPNNLSRADVEWLYSTLNSEGLMNRLMKEIVANSLSPTDATSYMDMVYVLSKLSELDKYNSLWSTVEIVDGQSGVTRWNKICTDWLFTIGMGLSDNNGNVQRFRSANHTAAAVYKLQPQLILGDIVYPNYAVADDQLSPDEDFWRLRKATWGTVTEMIKVPMGRILAFQKYAGLMIIMKIHNIYDSSLPAFLDQRIEGLGDASFFVNSRVLSFSIMGTTANETIVKGNPISFTLPHQRQQDDRPFLKGAVLCAVWKYSELNDNKIGAWDTNGCELVRTDDGESHCKCLEQGDYAVLMENYAPPDAISVDYYDAPLVLYFISIVCLVIFIATIVVRKGLHYEMHFVHSNLAFAMMLALLFYASTMKANADKTACMIVSVFVQYSYTSAYAWFALATHYVCRAVVTGKLGGILFSYTLIGWGLPGVVVMICVATSVDLYGFGSRCFCSQNQNFLSIYIGTFLTLCVVVAPMLAVAVCNLRGKRWANRNPADWSDVKAALLGLTLMWPLYTVVWIMAILIYLIPQPYQSFDFCFEVFNSLQGILVLLFLGFTVPSFRNAFFCRRKYEKDMLLAEEHRRRKNELNPYFD